MDMLNSNLIIGIAGKKHSGKDTVYKAIHNLCRHDYCIKRLAFADEVKEEVAHACGVTVEYIETNKEKFRPMLQWWGTDFRRDMQDPNYWVYKWNAKMKYMLEHIKPPMIYVAPDVRFYNEVEAIEKLGGKLWYVAMFDQPATLYDDHKSETQLDFYQKYDFHIKNEWNKTKELINKVETQLRKMKVIE